MDGIFTNWAYWTAWEDSIAPKWLRQIRLLIYFACAGLVCLADPEGSLEDSGSGLQTNGGWRCPQHTKHRNLMNYKISETRANKQASRAYSRCTGANDLLPNCNASAADGLPLCRRHGAGAKFGGTHSWPPPSAPSSSPCSSAPPICQWTWRPDRQQF